MAMIHFNPTFYFISHEKLRMPNEYKMLLDEKDITYHEETEFTDIVAEADIMYMTRVQRERFSDPIEYEKTKNTYVLRRKNLQNVKDNLKILHPLPRVNEISRDVDDMPQAYYFEQAQNGVYTRQAIISVILDLDVESLK